MEFSHTGCCVVAAVLRMFPENQLCGYRGKSDAVAAFILWILVFHTDDGVGIHL